MKINVAILEQDQNYQNRLIVALREKFPENIEVFQCNAQNVASVIEAHEVKVLAIGQTVSADLSEVPERCAIVALTEERTEAAKAAAHLWNIGKVIRNDRSE